MKDSNIKLLIMDVDGTLTDGKVYMSEHGELFKAFDIKDGLGIHNILPASGITPVIITGRRSNILKPALIIAPAVFIYLLLITLIVRTSEMI